MSAKTTIELRGKDPPRRHRAAEPQPNCGTAILAVTDSRAGSPCHENRCGPRRNWRIVVHRSRREPFRNVRVEIRARGIIQTPFYVASSLRGLCVSVVNFCWLRLPSAGYESVCPV